jgi:uncharacterized protein
MMYPRLSTLLVKPAGPDCNMACAYCFYTRKQELFPAPRRMSLETLGELTRQALAQAEDEVTFVWQGGEPTLAGLPFYRAALELQRRHCRPGQRVENALMTNGLLIDDEWCELLRDGGFLVGLSLDGPRDLHDRQRLRAGGQPTWEAVVAAARRLLARGVPVNALVLATELAAHRGREIYAALTGLGFTHLQLVPCVESAAVAGEAAAACTISADGFGQLLCDLFACWLADRGPDGGPRVSIRWFDAVVHRYLGRPPIECTLAKACGGYLVVEHDGSVYPCDFFVDGEHRLGDIHRDRLRALLHGEPHLRFARAKGDVAARCLSCKWLELCQGGCPKDRLVTADGASHLCEAYLRFFPHADRAMMEVARRRQRGPAAGPNDPCPCGSGKKRKRCCG